MNIQKLSKQLRREIKANPKRAVLLGVLMLVLAYFVGPLVWKSEKKTPTAHVATNTPAASGPTAAAPDVKTTAEPAPQHAWRKVAQWIDNSPRMTSSELPGADSLQRSPFTLSKELLAEIEPADDEQQDDKANSVETVVEVPTTPATLGMVLSSTVIGPQGRKALINGKVYQQGCEVEVQDGIVFVIAEVGPRKVLLTRQGQNYELAINRAQELSRMQVRSAAP